MMFSDAHCHVNPVKGMGAAKIGERFRKSGGWFIGLVYLPPWHFGLDGGLSAYEKCFNILVESKRRIKEKGLECILFLGFHPTEVDWYARRGMKLDEIKRLGQKVIDLVAQYINNGLAEGIGEVGRQHYPTSPRYLSIAEEVTLYALERAADLNVPVHLHLEQKGLLTLNWVLKIINETGVKKDKVIIHHIDPSLLHHVIEKGLWSTVLASKRTLRDAVKNPPYYLIESDFLDDPNRPRAVIVPWSIPRAWAHVLSKQLCTEEYVQKINVDNVKKVYEI